MQAGHVVKSFTLAEGDDANINVILTKFHEHFVLKRNIIHERARFHQSIKTNERRSNRLYGASMNYRLNTVIFGQVVISKYGMGLSLKSWINMCLRSCS